MQSVQAASGFEPTLSNILSHLEGHNGLGLELGTFTKNDKSTHRMLTILGRGVERYGHAHIPTHESF